MQENKIGDITQILPLNSPSVLQLEILEITHINITYIHNDELIIYNEILPAQTNIEVLFDNRIMFDLLNSNHIHAKLNGSSMDHFFTKNNVSVRGSFIVNSGQLYLGYFSEPDKKQ